MEDAQLIVVRDSEPSAWLAPSPTLLQSAKVASKHLFSLATARYRPKSPLGELFTEGFDAEQIWQQIDIQDQPLLSAARRQLRRLGALDDDSFLLHNDDNQKKVDENQQDEDGIEDAIDKDGDECENEDAGEDEEGEDEDGEVKGVEDKFLKMEDMENFLNNAEAEAARDTPPAQRSEEEDEHDDDDDDEMDQAAVGGGSDEEEIRYDDFFGKEQKKNQKKKKNVSFDDEEEEEEDCDVPEKQEEQEERKSTHEKEVEKMQKRIEQLENANLDKKNWTLQGEITAKKRPKNSALEVELDFQHNVPPPPVITEEVTASIEDLIRARIIEGRFDDVKRKEALNTAPPKERQEIDENKSAKGLGEIYESEYMQTTGFVAAPVSEAEAFRKEATAIFKSLCVKLDALSHFHFAPKPVIEEMGVPEDIPALAMEEVAPVFVSEASMLAPEEVFKGDKQVIKGDKQVIKDEKELSPSDRKRRRASKKRKFKAHEKAKEPVAKKVKKDEKESNSKKGKSSYVKSAKVFAELDKAKEGDVVKMPSKATKPQLKL